MKKHHSCFVVISVKGHRSLLETSSVQRNQANITDTQHLINQ